MSLVFRSKTKDRAETGVNDLAGIIRKVIASSGLDGSVRVMGVSVCIIEKKAANFRYQILLSGSSLSQINSVVRKALSLYREPSGVYIEIDVDPLNLM